MGAIFDTPNKGTFFNPKFIYTIVRNEQFDYLLSWANLFEINFERWIITTESGKFKDIIHLNLTPGIIFYSFEYNCIRGTFDKSQELLKLDEFIKIIIDDHRLE